MIVIRTNNILSIFFTPLVLPYLREMSVPELLQSGLLPKVTNSSHTSLGAKIIVPIVDKWLHCPQDAIVKHTT